MKINEISLPPRQSWNDADEEADLDKVFEHINKHCQPYLKMINYDLEAYPLYRGIRYEDQDFIIKDIRLDDRHPSDSSVDVHNIVNEYFQAKFGAPYRNAMFASGAMASAEVYGEKYMVFPIGQFTFLWSHNVIDLQVDHADKIEAALENSWRAAAGASADIDPNEFDHPEHYLDELEYQTTELKTAIKSGNEIMFRGKQYFAIPVIHANHSQTLRDFSALIERR